MEMGLFMYTYLDYLPTIEPPLDDFWCLEFLMFAGTFADHEETFSDIVSKPEVWFMVAKAWPHIPEISEPKKREVAFNDLRAFVGDKAAAEPNNLAEIINGAGGNLEDLARLIVLYIEGMVPAPGSGIHYMYIHITCAILDFVGRIEPTLSDRKNGRKELGPLATLLVGRNIGKALIDIACAVGTSTWSQATHVLNRTFAFLGSILMARPTDIRRFSDALEHKILRALVICGRGPNGAKMNGFLKFFLGILIPQQLVYPDVLSALDCALDDVEELVATDDFKSSEMYDHWYPFAVLAEERIAVLESYEETPCIKACDNLECGVIQHKSAFKRCSACGCFYYCGQACQALDWIKGGHRKACQFYGTLSLSEYTAQGLSTRERSFLRALIQSDYQKSKGTMFPRHLLLLRGQPGEGHLTLYDYTRGAVKITLKQACGAETQKVLGGPEWTDIVSRAERSRGRMSLDIMAYNGRNGLRYHAVPRRSSKATVIDGLQTLLNELPADLENWDEEFVGNRLQSLMNFNNEDPDLVEVH